MVNNNNESQQTVTVRSSAVCFDNVSKSYARKSALALESVSFDVPTGACYALMGVNGAGKTTLIKCLLGLAKQSTGQIHILSQDAAMASTREGLSYLPERFAPPPWLKVRDYLNLIQNLGQNKHGLSEQTAMLATLDMEASTLALTVKECSKGMVQKTGLAGVFLSSAKVLILDEPMSGLDPLSRIQVKMLIKLALAQNRTVLMCTHSLADVQELADHIAVLHKGCLKFAGTLQQWRDVHKTDNLEQAYLATVQD
jgi:ABC-type multidrug transport system ATPase subunit